MSASLPPPPTAAQVVPTISYRSSRRPFYLFVVLGLLSAAAVTVAASTSGRTTAFQTAAACLAASYFVAVPAIAARRRKLTRLRMDAWALHAWSRGERLRVSRELVAAYAIGTSPRRVLLFDHDGSLLAGVLLHQRVPRDPVDRFFALTGVARRSRRVSSNHSAPESIEETEAIDVTDGLEPAEPSQPAEPSETFESQGTAPVGVTLPPPRPQESMEPPASPA